MNRHCRNEVACKNVDNHLYVEMRRCESAANKAIVQKKIQSESDMWRDMSQMYGELLRTLRSREETCEWRFSPDGDFHEWKTECGHLFIFSDGNPSENGFDFCPFCGRELVER